MLHHQFYLLFCHQSENTRKSVRLVRRLEQLGIASSPAKKELGLDSLKDSDTYFFTIIFLNFNGFLQWKRKKNVTFCSPSLCLPFKSNSKTLIRRLGEKDFSSNISSIEILTEILWPWIAVNFNVHWIPVKFISRYFLSSCRIYFQSNDSKEL